MALVDDLEGGLIPAPDALDQVLVAPEGQQLLRTARNRAATGWKADCVGHASIVPCRGVRANTIGSLNAPDRARFAETQRAGDTEIHAFTPRTTEPFGSGGV